MEKRYQVFVSSTFTDLSDARRAVMQALLGIDWLLGDVAVGTELEILAAGDADDAVVAEAGHLLPERARLVVERAARVLGLSARRDGEREEALRGREGECAHGGHRTHRACQPATGRICADDAVKRVKSNARVFVHGAAATPTGMIDALCRRTDVEGVRSSDGTLVRSLTAPQAEAMIDERSITGGMIPKIETCIYALEKGVEAVVILDGKVPHAALIELFTDTGSGTIIRR